MSRTKICHLHFIYVYPLYLLSSNKKNKIHTMINKHNEKRVYISAELDATEKKNQKDLPKRTNKFFFDKEQSKTKRIVHKLFKI